MSIYQFTCLDSEQSNSGLTSSKHSKCEKDLSLKQSPLFRNITILENILAKLDYNNLQHFKTSNTNKNSSVSTCKYQFHTVRYNVVMPTFTCGLKYDLLYYYYYYSFYFSFRQNGIEFKYCPCIIFSCNMKMIRILIMVRSYILNN